MKQNSQKVLIFVDEVYEDLEVHYPRYRLIEAGKKVFVAGDKKDHAYKGKYGYPCKADLLFSEVVVDNFDALIIPGGYAPDKLRRNPKVLEITKQFHDQKKLIAFICHAGWVPISAKIVKDINCTSFSAIKDDMINAGCHWVDQPVVIDQNLITSRCPDDLPQFCQAIIEYLSQ